MAVDERQQRQWIEKRDRRERFRAAWALLKKYRPREGEDDEAFERRMRHENDMYALECDLREDVANDEDGND